MWKLQGALGKLALVKDKASDGVAAVRKKLGRNKDIQCRVHLMVKGSHQLPTHTTPVCYPAQCSWEAHQSKCYYMMHGTSHRPSEPTAAGS